MSAVVWLMLTFAHDRLPSVMWWVMGGLNRNPQYWSVLTIAGPLLVIGTVVLSLLGRPLDALRAGDDTARALGIPVAVLVPVVLTAASLTVAAAVAAGGVIGFVGLVAPHLARPLAGAAHSRLVPTAALVGAVLLVPADLLARSLMETQELPLGVITALAGGPVFLLVLRTSARREGGGMSTVAVHQLSCGYGRRAVLKDVSFTLNPGELTAVLGPNGCGKTTLLKTLARLLRARRVSDNRLSPARLARRRAFARRIAFAPQVLAPDWPFSVTEYVALGRIPHAGWWTPLSDADKAVIEQSIARFGLTPMAQTRVTELSGGEWQRARLAKALAQEPQVLLLDEPTAHLDPRFQFELLSLVRGLIAERKLCVAVTLHDLNLARPVGGSGGCVGERRGDRRRLAGGGADGGKVGRGVLGHVRCRTAPGHRHTGRHHPQVGTPCGCPQLWAPTRVPYTTNRASMRRVFPLLLLLTLGCQPSGCTRTPAPDGPTVTDDLGRSVVVYKSPKRIVSLSRPPPPKSCSPSARGPNVVAGTEYDTYPDEAKKLPRIGGFTPQSINVEAIVKHQPDLVIAAPQKDVIAALEKFGIPVHRPRPERHGRRVEQRRTARQSHRTRGESEGNRGARAEAIHVTRRVFPTALPSPLRARR